MFTSDSGRSQPAEDGFGLIEIVVALFMLALLSIAFLPLLITALKTSVQNSSLATSTQLVNQQMELGTSTAASTPTCGLIKTFVAATLGTTNDRNGNVLQPHRQLVVGAGTDASGCPTSYPGTVTYRAWITKSGSSSVLAEATTLYYVSAATP
jgi:type II secretory pathway pseudopilin PulG